MLSLVKITFKPIREVVIFECVYYPTIQELAESLKILVKLGQPAVLAWAEGVLFMHTSLSPTTDKIFSEFVNGRVYWPSVSYTLMPEYQSVVKVDALEIPVVNVSYNSVLREVAKWLKSRIKIK